MLTGDVATRRVRRAANRGSALALACASLTLGCDREQSPSPGQAQSPLASPSAQATGQPQAPASAAAPPSAAHEPPTGKLVFEPWNPPRGGEPVEPPESLLETWRVFVNQEKPRQKKNPQWRKLPPKKALKLEMADDGSYRCLVTPLQARPQPNEDHDAVAAWVLTRSLRCSSDGWKTWTDSPHVVIVPSEGERRAVVEHTDVFLRERFGDKVRETTLILRSDEEDDGRATTGPPKVVDAPQHVED